MVENLEQHSFISFTAECGLQKSYGGFYYAKHYRLDRKIALCHGNIETKVCM